MRPQVARRVLIPLRRGRVGRNCVAENDGFNLVIARERLKRDEACEQKTNGDSVDHWGSISVRIGLKHRDREASENRKESGARYLSIVSIDISMHKSYDLLTGCFLKECIKWTLNGMAIKIRSIYSNME